MRTQLRQEAMRWKFFRSASVPSVEWSPSTENRSHFSSGCRLWNSGMLVSEGPRVRWKRSGKSSVARAAWRSV